MPEIYPDFFNDVFGPIMQPFSSSHTAAPCRIAYLANCLLDEEVKDVTIAIKPEGSFRKAFKMHFQLALSGRSAIFPLDEVIDLADKIGRLGCKERDACHGNWGHNSLPAAKKAGREFADWNREQDKKEVFAL
jgi:hypothetical protein